MMPFSIDEVRAQAGEVRAALLVPLEAGDFAAEILRLNSAIDQLALVKSQVEVGSLAGDERVRLEADLRALKVDLARLAALTGHGEAFWRSWGSMLGLDACGYTRAGLPQGLSAG